MFKLATINTVMWPVAVPVPQDGGTVKTQKFQAQFKMLPQTRLDQIFGPAQSETSDVRLTSCKEGHHGCLFRFGRQASRQPLCGDVPNLYGPRPPPSLAVGRPS